MALKPATADEKLALVRAVNHLEPAYKFAVDSTVVEVLPLAFYHGAPLVKVSRPLPGQTPLWYVRLENEIVPLDGSIANIHHLNAQAPLLLTPETVADYLKFRLWFAREGALEGVVASETPHGFQARARISLADGAYDAQLAVTLRGETTIISREKTGAGKPAPADFSL
ncbi:MAG: hypothetical protein PW788_11770 [Micavibrio sp.]|nr:hypothetical protein [Micavibrio sp.]